MVESGTDVSTYCVVQTADAFEYAAGKRWGPYVHLCDAEARVKLLKHHGGNGRIITGVNEPPCQERRA